MCPYEAIGCRTSFPDGAPRRYLSTHVRTLWRTPLDAPVPCELSARWIWFRAGGTAAQKNNTITAPTARKKDRIAAGCGTRWRCSHTTPGRIAAANVRERSSRTTMLRTCQIPNVKTDTDRRGATPCTARRTTSRSSIAAWPLGAHGRRRRYSVRRRSTTICSSMSFRGAGRDLRHVADRDLRFRWVLLRDRPDLVE
jgi:hypothetical protein